MAVEIFASSGQLGTRAGGSLARFSPARPNWVVLQVQQRVRFRLAFRQMFFHIFTGRTPTHTSAFNGAGFQMCSASRRRIAGLQAHRVLFASSDACWRCAGVDAFSSDFALVSLRAVAFTQATGSGE